MNIDELSLWFSEERQSTVVERLIASQGVGLTEKRAKYLVRLCAYLCIKQRRESQPDAVPPLQSLLPPKQFMNCTHADAHQLFYSDQDRGSERAAGAMLKALKDLGFIKSRFTGNTTQILIKPIPQLINEVQQASAIILEVDDFNPRGDAVPISALLADNYNWMNRNDRSIPQRICELLRQWAVQYGKGMRVLRRADNQNPVGFYLLFPITKGSESVLYGLPNEGLHLGSLNEDDPFEMAKPSDENCTSLFVRSWVISEDYRQEYTGVFLEDVQLTLGKIQQDFPNLCDLWTLIIHPRYDRLASRVGFQRYNQRTGNTLYWMYQSYDRFMTLDMKTAMRDFQG